jgi:hypothetical protein
VNNQFLPTDQLFFCGINNFVLSIVRVCIGILQINLDDFVTLYPNFETEFVNHNFSGNLPEHKFILRKTFEFHCSYRSLSAFSVVVSFLYFIYKIVTCNDVRWPVYLPLQFN